MKDEMNCECEGTVVEGETTIWFFRIEMQQIIIKVRGDDRARKSEHIIEN